MQCSRSLRRLARAPQSQCAASRSSYRSIHATTCLQEESHKPNGQSSSTPSRTREAVTRPATQAGKPTSTKRPVEAVTSASTLTSRARSGRKRLFLRERNKDIEADHLLPENQMVIRRGQRVGIRENQPTKNLEPFTATEIEKLKDFYSPQQIAAIRAGEENISPQDIANQAVLYNDPMGLTYLDDFSDHRPVIDKNPETPGVGNPKTGKMPTFRWKDERDMADDLEEWLDAQPADGGDPANWSKFVQEYKPYHSKADLSKARYFNAPEIPPIDDPIMQSQARASVARAGGKIDEMAEDYEKLSKQTGFTIEQIKQFKVKFLVTRFVVNQTRLGKARSTYFMTIAGNGDGLLGIGEAKSQEPGDARKKAYLDAIRNIVPIRRYEGRTIFGSLFAKSGATELELHNRHPGFGARCQSLIWEMCKLAGIKDISAKVTRSRNPMNIVKATMNALRNQPDPDAIALARGQRMVDLRKVYYAGGNS